MQESNLKELRENTLAFYNSLRAIPYDRLTTEIVDQKLKESHLDASHLDRRYLERLIERKQTRA